MGCNQSNAVGGAPRNPGVQTSGNTVRVPAPWKADSALTQAKLDSDRATFWDTTARIQGNPRAWEAIRVAADALLNGDQELANTILEASDIKTPHGTLSLCYDARGFAYELPLFIFSSPTNIISQEEAASPKRTGHSGSVQELPITLRLSSSSRTTEQDVNIVVQSNERIATVKQRLNSQLAAGVYDNPVALPDMPTSVRRGEGNKWAGIGLPVTHQRFYCQGRLLPDDCMIQECGIKPHMIVQVFIKPPVR